MITIVIHQETLTASEMSNDLVTIATQLKQGFTSGNDPVSWTLEGEEEDPEDWE